MLSEKDIKGLNIELLKNEALSKHCSYGIGGPAKYFAKVKDFDSLSNLIKIANNKKIKWTILGSGTNLLISDKGFNGLVIQLKGNFNHVEFDAKKKICVCGAGTKLARVFNLYKLNLYKGLEFCAGIPGTVGGAVKMNAGRKTDWLSQKIVSIKICDRSGKIKDLDARKLKWGYRTSEIKDDQVVLSITLKAMPCKDHNEQLKIYEKVVQYAKVRRASQPLGKKNCGSVFKNPKDTFAGELVEDAGFKGKVIGGAQVSKKHANFINNENNASAKDVIKLINAIQKAVYKKSKIKLIPEVRFLGFDKKVSLF